MLFLSRANVFSRVFYLELESKCTRYFKKSQMFRTQETIIAICWMQQMKKLKDWQAFSRISDIKAILII